MCATIRVDLWDQTWDGLGMGRLTDRSVKTVGEGRHGDGDGLQLIVSARPAAANGFFVIS